jgi:hypothetical protein
MENKYYNPDVEDIRIGYELECLDEDDNTWIPAVVSNQSDLCNFTGLDLKLRVPFLTKEQIEKEGWEYKKEMVDFPTQLEYASLYVKGNIWLIYTKDGDISFVPIDPSLEKYEHKHRYLGPCPSINELRYLTKLLNIK